MITAALTAGSVVGSALTGAAQAKAAKEAAKRQQEQARAQLGQGYAKMGQDDQQYAQSANLQRSQYLDQRAEAAQKMQRRRDMAPLADKAAYYLAQRAGMAPQAWAGRDPTRGANSGATGNDMGLSQLAQGMGQYKAGMGGVSTQGMDDALARYRSQADVPGMYQPREAADYQTEAEITQQQMAMANDPRAAEQAKYRARIAQLQAMRRGMAPGGAGGGASASEMVASRFTPYLLG